MRLNNNHKARRQLTTRSKIRNELQFQEDLSKRSTRCYDPVEMGSLILQGSVKASLRMP